MPHFDLVVIGSGSGNTVVDERFDGWSVAVVERRTFGGTCLNRGCIPSKMLVRTADLVRSGQQSERFGLEVEVDAVDWPAVRDRVFGRTDADARDGRRSRLEQENVTVYAGEARFTGPRALRVRLADGSHERLTADQVVIAVGSRPSVPQIDGLDDLVGPHVPLPGEPDDPDHPHRADWYTSDDVMRMAELPRRLAILGGGYVGVELAHVFAALGSRVTQVDSGDTLLSDHDADVAASFTAFARGRWDVRTGSTVERVTRTGTGLRLELAPTGAEDAGTEAGEIEAGGIEVDALLLAVGRRPNADRLDVGAAGVEVDDRGVVTVDEHQRTSAEGVWALGDVSSATPLKHSANQDARVVQHNLLHPDDLVTSDHRYVPSAVFSEPQVAAVGLTEEQARRSGTDLAVGTADLADTAFGWALEDDRRRDAATENGGAAPRHLVKLLADRGTGRIVGAHVIAPEASVLIQPLVLAITLGLPVRGLARSHYWIHPSPTEVVEAALLDLEDSLGPEPAPGV